ncbi:MAG: type IV pilus biogenesis/stability protein PilW [Xanthomonadales bacterium]|nr:type IV pilus biogenesis/stability protein PilW [Xanthomonadales bacterium]
MKASILRLSLVLFLSLVLSACGSTGETRTGEKSDGRKAAETNAALGRQYFDRKQYEIALEKLKRAVAFDPTYAPAHSMLGVLYETLGEMVKAGEEYKQAVRYDPEDGDVNNNYAVYLCGHGNYKEADQHFATALKDPFYNTKYVAAGNAGLCALNNNDLDKAELYLRQSLEYDQKYSQALLPMAQLSYRKQDFLRARAFLQRFESAGQINSESLYLGYLIESELGDGKSASQYRENLMDQFPGSAEAAELRNRT